MASKKKTTRPSASGFESNLPLGLTQLRGELLRRLDLAEREVHALVETKGSSVLAGSVATLEAMERELRERLAVLEPSTCAEQRAEIIELWREHRRAFEELANKFQRRHSVRPGQRREGPRW